MRICIALVLFFIPSVAFAQAQPHIVMILGDDALRGHIAQFRTDNVDTAWTADGDTATPNLDLIAQAGVMVDHMVTGYLCTPTRAMVMGYGWPYMPSNLMGDVQDMNQPIGHDLEVNPYFKTLVDYAHDLSYEVVLIGKTHLARISWREQTEVETDTPGASDVSWVKAAGFDRADYMIGNSRHASYLATLPAGSPTLDADDVDCLGHNDFVRCDLDGTCTQQTAKHSTVYFMDALQADLAANPNTKTLYLFWPSVAHSPHEWGTANNCAGGTRTQDDRVASSTCSDVDCVYEEFIENLDTEIGDLMADMNGGGGLLCTNLFDDAGDPQTTGSPDNLCDTGRDPILDTLLFTWDNGVPNNMTSPNDCEVSAGIKASPFPCSTIGGLVTAGAEVTANGHLTGLHSVADIPKTLEQMMGGTGKGMTTAGFSIMDCLDGTVTLANCPTHDFVPYVEWEPIGSAKTKGTMPLRMPGCATDAAGDWSKMEMGGWTYNFNGRYLLHRIYSMDGTCNYTEQLYDTDGTTDRYIVLDATQPIADSGPTPASGNSIDCAISGEHWAVGYTEDGDDESACNLLHDNLDPIMSSLGIPKIAFGGGSF